MIHRDRKKYRKRIRSIDEDHARISPYAHHMRITLYDSEDLDHFIRLCGVVGLRAPIRASIDSESHCFFTREELRRIKKALDEKTMPWSAAFQIEALLHNGLLTTADLAFQGQLWRAVTKLLREQPLLSGQVLRAFHEELMHRNWNTFHAQNNTLYTLFEHVKNTYLATLAQSQTTQRQGGSMDCYHVTFTPTRMALEGPYAMQSNRVIRQYANFVENFIRVDFRDEDRLQYHFEYEVDGEVFVQEQVGGILNEGFSLAGRHFDFLGYSSSALREHSMWFVHPFVHPQQGWTTASTIRRLLGDFSGEMLRPAKYAARLGQAFTATNPSVSISASQLKRVRDMGQRPYQHTDGTVHNNLRERHTERLHFAGVGTISRSLAILIWEKTGDERKIMPSVVSFFSFAIRGFQFQFFYSGKFGFLDSKEWYLSTMNLRES